MGQPFLRAIVQNGWNLPDGAINRVPLPLDCYDREAIGHVAATGGITAQDVQDLMVVTAKHRYGLVNRSPRSMEADR